MGRGMCYNVIENDLVKKSKIERRNERGEFYRCHYP